MAQVFVDDARLKAGAEYLSSLNKIGFEPEGLFWAWDKSDERFVLVLVSKFFDVAGPLKLSQLLFKAYRGAITPSDINPLELRLHSPDQTWVRQLVAFVDGRKAVGTYSDDLLEVSVGDIYRLAGAKAADAELLRYWQFLERNVEQLAA